MVVLITVGLIMTVPVPAAVPTAVPAAVPAAVSAAVPLFLTKKRDRICDHDLCPFGITVTLTHHDHNQNHNL